MAWTTLVDNAKMYSIEWDADIPMNADFNPPAFTLREGPKQLYWQKQIDAGTNTTSATHALSLGFDIRIPGTNTYATSADSLRYWGRDGMLTTMGDANIDNNGRQLWRIIWGNGAYGPALQPIPLAEMRVNVDYNAGDQVGTVNFDEFRFFCYYGSVAGTVSG